MIWFQSASYKNMQIFLNFINFYYHFINYYFKIVVLLTGLLKGSVKNKKTEPFEFFLVTEKVFDELQKVFCLTFILKYFNSALFIQLKINIFSFAFASILSQLFRNLSEDNTS